MKRTLRLLLLPSLLAYLGSPLATGQILPAPLSFTLNGQFQNGISESTNSLLYTDNNLTDGYASGIDLQDAPASLTPTGPAGSAMFQWGRASTSSSYAHSSALWFEPQAALNVQPEQSFTLGTLYYRNGTIVSNTGASGVDLAVTLNFSVPSGMAPINAVYHSNLLNTTNSSDQVASADIVSLGNISSPLAFTDAAGYRYYLEMTFQVDQNTLDGTLSTVNQFRVFEGMQGSAELLGRFTTAPADGVPEPGGTALAAVAGILLVWRRRR